MNFENHTFGWNLVQSYTSLPHSFYTEVLPTPVHSPKLVILNKPLANSLGLNVQALESDEGVAILAGNQLPKETTSIAQAYGGHQFGHFNMLGDGRAVLLGEQITPHGKEYDIQLKGSGRTPYSRGGDGRAALGPMLREYIISEAMYALDIPTTRSLAVVSTGEYIIRESALPGAILTRIARSHIRVGTFQYIAKWGTFEELKALADYTIQRHYATVAPTQNPYLSFLKEVINRQAELIAKWQLVGFIHGVMNTDNMTVSGETIDYGPCAFMDAYNPETVFSSIDSQGRYAYGNQPYIGGWNLSRFAETLLPLIDDQQDRAIQLAQEAITEYSEQFHQSWLKGMRRKIGLIDEEEDDESLIEELLTLMKRTSADFTNTFRALSTGIFEDMDLFDTLDFKHWINLWQKRLSLQNESQEAIQNLMKNNNPNIIPRNHRVEEALEAAAGGDLQVMEKLLSMITKPFDYSITEMDYHMPAPTSSCPYRTFCGT